MHEGKSEGVTHESLSHHHLIPYQFEWEKSLVDEIEKERKRKERGRREKERKGRGRGKNGKNQQVFLRSMTLRRTEFI